MADVILSEENEIAKSFGRLTVIGLPFRKQYGTKGRMQLYVECRCSCGTVKTYQLTHLKTGHTQSCGCLGREQTAERLVTHGHSRRGKRSLEYITWKNMIRRRTNPNGKDYPNYGGRGIKVCDRWSDFQNFLEDMGPRPEGMSLDRKDPNGHYCPENCRRATDKEQCNNRRCNRLITAFGRTQTRAQWAEEIGIPYFTLRARLDAQWPTEKALTTPVRAHK